MKKNRPVPVNFDDNYWDRLCLELVKKGFSGKYIARVTGLNTAGRVYYRNKKANVKAMDYRNGLTKEAEQQLKQIKADLARINFLFTTIKER